MSNLSEPLLVLFDGTCNLCNGVVQFLIRQDKSGMRFRFAAQQSAIGQQRLQEAGMPVTGDSADTMMVYRNGHLFTHSDAVLEIARRLPFPFPVFYSGKILPRFLRDTLYKWVARNRYKWFGKREQCMLPTPELRARFLS